MLMIPMSLTIVDGLTFQENIGNSLSYLFLALSSTVKKLCIWFFPPDHHQKIA